MSEFSSSRADLWPGVPLALASAILFGASAPFAKLLLGSVDPQLLAGLLYLGAGTGLVVVHVVRRLIGLEAPEAPLRRSDIPWLVTVIVFGGGLGGISKPAIAICGRCSWSGRWR
jgi:drug/metabolite transporter (DMT)-like permease